MKAAGRRRRLLSDLGLAVRASRRRQCPRLAAHDARAARQAVPGWPHRASAARRQSPARLSAGARRSSSAANARASAPQEAQPAGGAVRPRSQDAEEADDNASARQSAPPPARRAAPTMPAPAPTPVAAPAKPVVAAVTPQPVPAARPWCWPPRRRAARRAGARAAAADAADLSDRLGRQPAGAAWLRAKPRRSTSPRCRRTTSSTCAASGTASAEPRACRRCVSLSSAGRRTLAAAPSRDSQRRSPFARPDRVPTEIALAYAAQIDAAGPTPPARPPASTRARPAGRTRHRHQPRAAPRSRRSRPTLMSQPAGAGRRPAERSLAARA